MNATAISGKPIGIFLVRFAGNDDEPQLVSGKIADQKALRVVQEGELKFQVNLSDYLDTGLFLDHRITRDRVREEAAGKRVLNLFAYTGAFSVYAAAGGAQHVTTLDLSNTYLDWAKRNFQLNNLPVNQHAFIRADATDILRQSNSNSPFAPNSAPKYDLAIVDPPTFSNSKSTDTDWEVQTDHAPLLNALAKRMNAQGVIYFSTNFHRFKLNEQDLRGITCKEITHQTVPEDFANKKTHRCWRMTVGP